ncbi:hypothetical protein B0A50_03642 [Salinomyces thailandicus]|uniref:Uncharacterized protein n=1 Tax=Salinomyces thailandicus TaxID=706561 RepID=A0A4U0U3N3_9PEZI|nr:hypothetical protein B0A50_03642 [Salinomyces thailandica]
MLNPLTAHGLAGNVMQFIRFALELVTEGERVYNAAEEARRRSLQVSEEVDDSSWQSPIRLGRALSIAGAATSKPKKLKRLARSGKQAILAAWRRESREQLAVRLEGYQKQINTRVLFSLRRSLQDSDTRSSHQFEVLDERTKALLVAVTVGGDRVDDRLNDQIELTAEQAQGNQLLLTLFGDRRSPNGGKLRHLLEPSAPEQETLARLQAERHPSEIAAFLSDIHPRQQSMLWTLLSNNDEGNCNFSTH